MRMAFFVIIIVALFLPNLFNKDINPTPAYNGIEDFDPSLAYINSIEKLEKHIDSTALSQHIAAGSFDYALLAEAITKKRFYHGFSHFTLKENWVAAVAGRFIKEDLACKVKPEDIIQNSNAACSQQSIVLMALLRKKNIDCRKVGFPHHYAIEAMIDKNWYFFDADMEPLMTREQRMESNWKLQSDLLKPYYHTKKYSKLNYGFGFGQTATTGITNEDPAPRARAFQAFTNILSKILWCLPLLFILLRPSFSFRPLFRLPSIRKNNTPSLATA